ncbi:hypothetical protein [Aquimarina algicola]|uniref:DUF4097 domain-containing protein n=1 Tax=Aquimarina algicola TaxID=2589995 RepID=A0A504JCQ9_9FLAO|nr:hypothetical protein [Aquimarina algicola]TPN84699.1 hypothetical protein FHK87_17380 [Aquimarina algicola]
MRYKHNIAVYSLFLSCASLFAQEKHFKLNEKLDVDDEVTVNLNTSHTNIVFETWNKNTIQVEAYLEGDLSDENSKLVLDSWQVNISGDDQQITINSRAGNLWKKSISVNKNIDIQQLRMLSPMISDMLGPMMENIAKNPMPSALSKQQSNVNYGKNSSSNGEEKYVQQWENQIREKFGNGTTDQKWNKELNNSQQIKPSNTAEVNLNTWARQQYGKEMHAWASQLISDFQKQQGQGTADVTVYQYTSTRTNTGNTSKVIKVKMPKKAKLRLNIRHGDVKLPDYANNVIASLSHTKLSANTIEGNQTFIKVSYSPVFVKQWNNGRLVVNYVKNCRIQNADNLLVNADSSNIFVQQLNKNGAISGSFGMITIANLGESFSTLDLAVKNSDFKLKLPKTALNLSYSGAQSIISLPKTLKINTRKNFGNVFVNGFQYTRSTDKMITINAKFSEVVLDN